MCVIVNSVMLIGELILYQILKHELKSLKRPLSFSLTTMAVVECLEKIEMIPLSMSIRSLILDVISIISKFLEVFNFKDF